jgi:hypothetical protein
MLIRLWWKEFRVFGPVWLTLVVAGALFQWLLYSTRYDDVRTGSLTFIALCWAVLYTIAVASAAFSGERESNTLGFLDALPVSRPILWLGKASFAIVSTAGLVLVLVGMAELGTSDRPSSGMYSWWSTAEIFGPLLIEGLAWGLFWSALSRNTLLTATMAVVSVAGVMIPAADRPYAINERSTFWKSNELRSIVILGSAASLAVGASLVILSWRPSRGWSILKKTSSRTSKPIKIRSASTGRSLFWQVGREGWTTGLLVALLAWFIPVDSWLQSDRLDTLLVILMTILAALVAGVSVFGSENTIGSRQFLVHHGVKASAIWWRRLLAWGLVKGSILGVMVLLVPSAPAFSFNGPMFPGIDPRSERIALFTFSSLNAFAIGILCGMTIRRRITAVLVGSMVCVALVTPQFVLMSVGMIPLWSLVLVPLILLAISAAWANDWLLEPEGFRRWARLGLLTVVPFGVLSGVYIAYRGLGVANVAPVFTSGTLENATIPADQNAADLYRRAIALIQPDYRRRARLYQAGTIADSLESVVGNMTTPEQVKIAKDLLQENLPAIALSKTASALNGVQFEPLARSSLFSADGELYSDLWVLGLLLALETNDRRAKGDLTGTWDDILAQFRMANQLAETRPTDHSMQISFEIEAQAVRQAFEWLIDPHQTLESIRKALADLKALPPLPGMGHWLRYQSLLIERALDLPSDELTEKIIQSQGGRERHTAVEYLLSNWFVTPAWEQLRARRICRKIVAEDLAAVTAEPWNRNPSWHGATKNLTQFQGSLLARSLCQLPVWPLVDRLDRDTVNRRALDQVVALVVWKLEHGGKDAEKLEDLVPGLLEKLPLDPYSGKPFGYFRSQVERSRRFDLSMRIGLSPIPTGDLPMSIGLPPISTRVGQQMIVFSVGMEPSDEKSTKVIPAGDGQRPTSGSFQFPVP